MERTGIQTGNVVSVAIAYTPEELSPLGVKLAKVASIVRGFGDEDLRSVWQAIDILACLANALDHRARKEAAGIRSAAAKVGKRKRRQGRKPR